MRRRWAGLSTIQRRGLCGPRICSVTRDSVRFPPSVDITSPDSPTRHLRLGKDHDSSEVTQPLREGRAGTQSSFVFVHDVSSCVLPGEEKEQKNTAVCQKPTQWTN